MELREIADFIDPAAAAHHSRRGAGHPDRRRGAPVPRRAQSGGDARARRHATSRSRRRSAQFGANTGGGFTDQYAREFLIRNIGRTHQPRRPAQPRRRHGRAASRSCCGRSPRSTSRRASSAATPAYMGKPAVIVSRREAARRRHGPADARDRGGAGASSRATLPHGIKADNILFRQANFIETSIDNVQKVLLEAVVVVAVVLFAVPAELAHDARSRSPPSRSRSSITVIVFHLMGLSINTMTLGGLAIAIGELVDDAVVDVENIFRRLRENREQGKPAAGLRCRGRRASQEVRSGIVYATMIIVLVFVPLFALSGIEGRLFAPLGHGLHHLDPGQPRRLDHADAGAWPTTCCRGLKRLDERESWLVRVLKRGNRAAAATGPSGTSALLMARRSLAVVDRGAFGARCCRARSCRPSTRARFTINMLFNPGISLAEVQPRRPHRRAADPGGAGGRRPSAGAPAAPNSTSTPKAFIPPRSKSTCKPAAAAKDEIVADIRARLAVLPVVDQRRPADLAPARPHAVGRARADRAQDLRRGPRHAARAGRGVAQRLAAVPGLVDLQVEKQVRIPQLEITRRLPARRALRRCSPRR